MAEGEECISSLNDENDLEEGEIDDLEEGEINEDIPGVSEYRFIPREETFPSENSSQTQANNTQSQNLTSYQRNSSRNTKNSRNNDERRAEAQFSKGYEKSRRTRASFKQRFAGRRPRNMSRFEKHDWRREKESVSRGQENFDTRPPRFASNYPVLSHKNPRRPSPSEMTSDFNLENEDDDFKSLLEQYIHMQEELDEFRSVFEDGSSLVDDIIDDTFVDVPLDNSDNSGNANTTVDDLDAEIRKLEMDFTQAKTNDTDASLENPVTSEDMKYSQSIPTTYSNNEKKFFGIFEPFQIKPNVTKVRTLSELSKMDLAARGIALEDTSQSKLGKDRSELNGKNRLRRRPQSSERKRVRRKGFSELSGGKASSSDFNEEFGVGFKKTNGSQTNGTTIIRKEKLKEWRRPQSSSTGANGQPLRDDYFQAPMEVETDSAEGAGIIEDLHPSLSLVDMSHPLPPGDEMVLASASHIIPLMDIKPYGYYHDYGSTWWGGPELPTTTQPFFTTQSTTANEVFQTSQENAEIPPNETYSSQTPEQNSLNGEQEDDEMSELALREQLLKSMVNKRAAKNAGKAIEKTVTSSVASPSNSRSSSPFTEPGTRKGSQEVLNTSASKTAPLQPKGNIAPPKHEPVVIHLGAESEDSESDGENANGKFNSFFGGLDSFIKEARERSSKPKPDENKTVDTDDKSGKPTTPTTPEVVSVLPEEKRNEYKKLKLQLALKEQQKGLGTKTKEDKNKAEVIQNKDSRKDITKQGKRQKELVQEQRLVESRELPRNSDSCRTEQKHPVTEMQVEDGRRREQNQHLQQRVQQELRKPNQQQQKHQQDGHQHQQLQQQYLATEPKQQQPEDSMIQESSENNELKLKHKILSEMLIGHKKLIAQDEKLLESRKDELNSRSKALEEHETRVLLLQQQLERAQRHKKVQQDLVEKLQLQNTRLSKRLLQRQSDAREVEERLLRTRALLVAQKSQKDAVIRAGEKSATKVKSTAINPGQDAPDGVTMRSQVRSKALTEVLGKFREMSKILDESVSARKEIKDNASLQPYKDSGNVSKPKPSRQTAIITQDKLTLEKQRLRILEQTLSQRLRQSDARRKIGTNSESARKTALQHEQERASSDSELHVRKSTSPRGSTPPVELVSSRDANQEYGDSRIKTPWDIFQDASCLEKVRKIQEQKETDGPSFPNMTSNVLLPAQLISTKCAWLGIEHASLLQHLEDITGCLADVGTFSVKECEVKERKQWESCARGPYRSPLVYFRSYRFSPYYRTKKGFTLDSPSFTHLINPRVPFCPFALQGICNDPKCTRQHPDDVIPRDEQILQDLAAYFTPARKKVSGDDDVTKAIQSSIDAVTKQYGDKVSPAELRVLFVNHLRKQTSSGIFNIVLEQRPWQPGSHGKNDPGVNAPDEGLVVQTENTFSWKSWKRKIESEIKTRSKNLDECQEIRYFSEKYDSVKTLEKATQENPSDESIWIRLTMVHMGLSRTEGDQNNNSRKNVDKALNTLAQALECNRHSEKLWLKYLDIFRLRATSEELYEVYEEAVEFAGSYTVWWAYLDIAMDYKRKAKVCLKCIEYLIKSETEKTLKSHRLLEIFLYLVELDLICDGHLAALSRFQVILNFSGPRDIPASLVENLTCEDLCLLWLCYIYLVEFACLPRDFYDPARSGPARIARKHGFVFPWKPGGGTRYGFAELLKLFHRALKECAAICQSADKVSPIFFLYKNLIALERASGRDPSAIRTCQRLLKASPKMIELWLCMAALQQVSGHGVNAINVYKKALQTCDGHAQIAYSAAKYFIEKKNQEECYEALALCVYSKFVLEVPSAGPKTRARSQDQPVILKPNPILLYKKILSQTLPLDAKIPPAKTGVIFSNLGSERTYIWLCYCMFIEIFSDEELKERHLQIQTAYESAVYNTGDRHEVKTLWTEYLYYMARRLKDGLCSSNEIHDVFHKCLSTVPAVSPLHYLPSKSWSDYTFHNEVLTLYRRCLGDSSTSNFYDKYLEMFPDNSVLAIQAVKHFYGKKELDKARKILSAILLKTPYNLELWKIAISMELKEHNFDQARQLYEHATEALPLASSLWKDFIMFDVAHGKSNMKEIQSLVSNAEEHGINLDEFLKEFSSKEQ